MLGDDLDDLAYFVLVTANRGWWQPGSTLDIDFANDRSYNPLTGYNSSPNGLLTYSSPSPKMVFWPDKLLRYAPHNMITYSDQFDNAAWGKAQATVTPDATTAPDGTSTADSLLETVSSNIHYMGETISSSPAGKMYVVSAYLKANTRSYATLGMSDISSGSLYAVGVFNLSNGTVATTGAAGTGYSVVSTSVTSVGNGWYRCAVVAFAGSSVSSLKTVVGINKTGVITGAAGGFESYLGDGSGIYVWGAMLSQGSYLFGYIPTTSAAVFNLPYDCSPTTGISNGVLIEEQRTNLLTYSEQFDNAAWLTANIVGITPNTGTAPDGTTTADAIKPSGSAAIHAIYRNPITVVSGTTYALNLYAKASGYNYIALMYHDGASTAGHETIQLFNLSNGTVGNSYNTAPDTAIIQDVGNGWYRCAITKSWATTSGNISLCPMNTDANPRTSLFAGDTTSGVYMWGAQFEAGAFATSYIPTTSSTVTRAADNISLATSAFSWSTSAFTVAGRYSQLFDQSVSAPRTEVFAATDAGNDRFAIRGADAGAGTKLVYGTGAAVAQTSTAATLSAGVVGKFAAGADASGGALYQNNTLVGTAAGAPALATGTVGFGSQGGGGTNLNGHLERLTYWSTRKSNSDLQALST